MTFFVLTGILLSAPLSLYLSAALTNIPVWYRLRDVLFNQLKTLPCLHSENSRQLCKPEMKSRICRTVVNSPNPLSVYIRLYKNRKKVFYCFYKLTFPRKNAKLFVMALIYREILASCEVLYTKSCMRNQFCKKDAFQNTDFSCLK